MKYVKHMANGISIIALAFIAFSSFTTSKSSEGAAYYGDYTQQGMLGEIRLVATNFEPENWRVCDGRSIEISRNQALYQTIGGLYGEVNETTFKLPDLRSKRVFTSDRPEDWDPYNIVGQYIICTKGYKTDYWDTWDSYYSDGIPSGW